MGSGKGQNCNVQFKIQESGQGNHFTNSKSLINKNRDTGKEHNLLEIVFKLLLTARWMVKAWLAEAIKKTAFKSMQLAKFI